MINLGSQRPHRALLVYAFGLAFLSFGAIRVYYARMHIPVAPGLIGPGLWLGSASLLAIAVGYATVAIADRLGSARKRSLYWAIGAMVIVLAAMVVFEYASARPDPGIPMPAIARASPNERWSCQRMAIEGLRLSPQTLI